MCNTAQHKVSTFTLIWNKYSGVFMDQLNCDVTLEIPKRLTVNPSKKRSVLFGLGFLRDAHSIRYFILRISLLLYLVNWNIRNVEDFSARLIYFSVLCCKNIQHSSMIRAEKIRRRKKNVRENGATFISQDDVK